jgi:hypothetical protein
MPLPVLGVDPGREGAAVLVAPGDAPLRCLGAWWWRPVKGGWLVSDTGDREWGAATLHDVAGWIRLDTRQLARAGHRVVLEGLYVSSLDRAPSVLALAESAGEVLGPLRGVGPVLRPTAATWRAKVLRLGRVSAARAEAYAIEAVPGIVAVGLAELRQYGVPDEVQKRIDVRLDGVPVPFLGFQDFGWSKHGITLDLKTQLRLSSESSSAHAAQVGLYIHGTNREGRIAYVTPSKCGVYRLENADEHVAALANIAQRLERFLRLSSDPNELAALVVPDWDHWMWSDPATRATGRAIFGF